MSRILPQIYHALYLSIFVLFMRRILDKISMMFDECVPIINEDDNEWYGVRLFHMYFLYSNITKESARKLAMHIYREIPELRGKIEVVQREDPEETPISEMKGIRQDTRTILYEILSDFDDDD